MRSPTRHGWVLLLVWCLANCSEEITDLAAVESSFPVVDGELIFADEASGKLPTAATKHTASKTLKKAGAVKPAAKAISVKAVSKPKVSTAAAKPAATTSASGSGGGGSGKFTVVAPDKLAPPILTPTLKKQVVTKSRLANGMGVYIVSDPSLEQSAMAVGVQVGSWKDPKDSLGMAHFVEHMMFMGTKQHPKPGNFDNFLAENGATISNAQTGSQSTCYAFATPNGAFKEGISRFAEFFTDPLFDSKGAAKEMHAVNQEFEMHKDQDGYRQYMVDKQLSNPAHPNQRFTIGNLATLSKVLNTKLVDWYQKHYSANIMHVAIYTAHPAAEIQKLVAEKLARVPNKNYKRQKVKVPVLRADLAMKVVHVKPLKQLHSISLKWELDSSFAHKRLARPDRLVGRVLGDEGPNSLLSTLKKNQLALSLSAGMSTVGRDNAVVEIEVSLTEKGMLARDVVIALVFKTIAEVRKAGIPKYIWDEMLTQDLNAWKFQGRTSDVFDSAMSSAESMMLEPLETYPRTLNIIQEYDGKDVKKILEALTPQTVHIGQMGGVFPPKGVAPKDVQTETYYKAKFAIAPVPKATIDLWTRASKGKLNSDDSVFSQLKKVGRFTMPKPNRYIPKNLKPASIDPSAPKFPNLPHPKLAVHNKFGKLYIGHDKVFGDPYISASIQIKTARALTDKLGPKAVVFVTLFCECISESIHSAAYQFRAAGLSYSLSMGKGTNLYINFGGKVPVESTYMALLKRILKPMKQALGRSTNKGTFNMLRKAMVRSLANSMKSGPSASAGRAMWTQLSNSRIPVEKLHAAAKSAKYEDLAAFMPQLLQKVSLEVFLFGQVNEAAGKRLYSFVESALKAKFGGQTHAPSVEEIMQAAGDGSKPGGNGALSNTTALLKAEEFVPEVRVLPANQGPWFLATQGSARGNATILFIDGGHLPCGESLALQVLYKVVGQMFFNELRTKQQTGYVASAYATTVARRTVALFNVESSWAGPGDLLGRFEKFTQNLLSGLKAGKVMPQKKLDMIRSSMLSAFSKPIQNVQAMGSTLEGIVKDYDGDFSTMKKRKALLEGLTLDMIVKVAEKVLGTQNKRRLAVFYTPTKVPHDAAPSPYTAFNNKIGKFQRKPKYKCAAPTVGKPAGSGSGSKPAAPAPAKKAATGAPATKAAAPAKKAPAAKKASMSPKAHGKVSSKKKLPKEALVQDLGETHEEGVLSLFEDLEKE
jgi:insulysin